MTDIYEQAEHWLRRRVAEDQRNAYHEAVNRANASIHRLKEQTGRPEIDILQAWFASDGDAQQALSILTTGEINGTD